MLILSRKCGESLIINDEIVIKITEISGDKVKIGIEAPQNYRILREEICQTVQSNKEAATKVATKELLNFIGELK
ncbi:carbon storage regulator CsrA [Oscillospiraceae bacterium PP1C4]